MAKNPFRQLNVIKELSRTEKMISDCYVLTYKKELWMQAYKRLRKKENLEDERRLQIDEAIAQLRAGTFRISKEREHFSQKELIYQVVAMILESVFAHIRTNDHDALLTMKRSWQEVNWTISINGIIKKKKAWKAIVLKEIAKKINDRRFNLLVHHLLKRISVNRNCRLVKIFIDIFMSHFMRKLQIDLQKDHQLQPAAMFIHSGEQMLIGIKGTKKMASMLRERIYQQFKEAYSSFFVLHDLHLTTFKKPIIFLRYAIYRKHKMTSSVVLEIPKQLFDQCVVKYGKGSPLKSIHRSYLANYPEHEIMQIYNAELKRFAHFYKLAHNFYLLRKLIYLAEGSFIRTVAFKRKSTMNQIIKKLKCPDEGRLMIRNHTQQCETFLRYKDVKHWRRRI